MKLIRKSSYEEVCNVKLPSKTISYTPISNKQIIEQVREQVLFNSINIVDEKYETCAGGQQVKMKFYIAGQSNEPFQITVLNSYDKQISARIASGIYSSICWNLNMVGDQNMLRKHTGNADLIINDFIKSTIDSQYGLYKKHDEKIEKYKMQFLSKSEMAELAGTLLIKENIITLSQINILKKEINKPSFEYDFDVNSTWGFYNHVTHALKSSTPINYLEKHSKFQTFMEEVYL